MELKRKVLNLKFDGQELALKFPTVRQIKELSVKKENESDLDMTVRFLSELGLPEATTLDMEPSHIEEIVSVLTGQKKKLISELEIEIARLCRFYGWGLDYVEGMDAEDFRMMLLAEEVISNRETLEKMRCADFPSINANERRNLHKEVHKRAFPNLKPKVIKFDDIGGLFNG